MLPPFEIHEPRTLGEAAAARRELGEDAALYAGGTELVLVMKEGLGAWSHLIDVKAIGELHELALVAGALRIGAAVTHRELEHSALVRDRFPLLAETEAQVANPRVRAVGTLGGNLAFAEPRSDPATTLLVYDARVTLAGPSGRRTLPLAAFLRGSYETALAPDEILAGVDVPAPPAPASGAYLKFGLHERPSVGVAALLLLARDGRTVAEARVAVGCVAAVPLRLTALEQSLAGAPLATLVAGVPAARTAGDALDAISDLHGSAEYKRHLVGVFVARALAAAARRATGIGR
ncbi:MAG: FAD binding domain-containing protein [Candidatus Rokubacteria bacterium]|nr:FAD binding domain-containing protein [Candidatus Rokubacteria bacterium]